MLGLEREWLKGEFGGGFWKKLFLNATLNFQKLRNEIEGSFVWAACSQHLLVSVKLYKQVQQGVPGSECAADGTSANI